jgi:hypothetical protein
MNEARQHLLEYLRQLWGLSTDPASPFCVETDGIQVDFRGPNVAVRRVRQGTSASNESRHVVAFYNPWLGEFQTPDRRPLIGAVLEAVHALRPPSSPMTPSQQADGRANVPEW